MSSIKEYIRHLHLVHCNSLNEESPVVDVSPPEIKIPFHSHQKAALKRMESLEKGLSTGLPIGTETLYGKYGILGDSVGAGKSLMVLGHIARMATLVNPPRSYSYQKGSSENFFSIQTTEYTDLSEAGSLIIVPHTLFRQWSDYIKKQTTLEAMCLGRSTEVDAETFIADLLKARLVLVSNTLLKTFFPRCSNEGIKWKRIFVDEADTIHMPGVSVNNFPVARFYWFVTASWANLIYPNTHFYFDKNYIQTHLLPNEAYNHLKNHFLSIMNTNSHYSYVTHTTKSWAFFREMLSLIHPLRSHLVIKCTDSFIQSSIALPPLYRSVIWCKAPLSHRIVGALVGPGIQQMLHAGDVTGALEQLGVKGQDSKTLITAVTATLRKELERHEKTRAFKASLDYHNAAAKELALKSLDEKIAKTQDSIKGIQDRINSIGTESCPICYDDPTEALVTPCCSRAFCAACLLLSMARNGECPMCRAKITPSACTKLIEANQIVTTGVSPEVEAEELKKNDALFKLIHENPTGRFLIFSRYDNPFEQIESAMDTLNIVVKQLKGNKDAIAATLKAFDSGAIRCLLLNSRFAGSGLNIIGATHVVLLHAMTHEEEKQILGRAYRMGRKGPLHFIKLLNKGEENYTEGEEAAATAL